MELAFITLAGFLGFIYFFSPLCVWPWAGFSALSNVEVPDTQVFF